MNAFLEAELRQLGGKRCNQESARGKHFKNSEVSVLWEVVAAYINDDARAPIHLCNLVQSELLRPVIHPEFRSKFRKPRCTPSVLGTEGLANPTEFKFARKFGPFKKLLSSSVRQEKSARMPRVLEYPVISGVKDNDMIKETGPTNPPARKCICISLKGDRGNLRILEVLRKKRVSRFEMKNPVGRGRNFSQDALERSIQWK